MSIWNAIILGLVQGITEFLPVSSSGHLSIISNLFDIVTINDGHLFFDVLLRLSTLIAVCVVYWQDIVEMFYEVFSFADLGPLAGSNQKHYPSARFFLLIVIATLPLFLILPINDYIESLYFQSIFIGIALILTGSMLFVSDKMTVGNKTEKNMTMLDALLIGICQAIATIPGLSRCGTTISAGISTGLKRDFAVKFSFLLSIPAIFGSLILSFVDAVREGIDFSAFPAYLIGMAVAIVAGIAAISLLKLIAEKGKFKGFAFYCWIAGALSIILTLIF